MGKFWTWRILRGKLAFTFIKSDSKAKIIKANWTSWKINKQNNRTKQDVQDIYQNTYGNLVLTVIGFQVGGRKDGLSKGLGRLVT